MSMVRLGMLCFVSVLSIQDEPGINVCYRNEYTAGDEWGPKKMK